MNTLHVKEFPSGVALLPLCEGLPWAFSPLRHHRLFSKEDAVRGYCGSFFAAPEHSMTRFIAAICDGTPVVIARLQELAWDSKFFSLPMVRLDIMRMEVADVNAVSALLDAVMMMLRSTFAGHHVSCHVDIDDYAVLNGLVAREFFVADAKRTYVARRRMHGVRNGRLVYSSRDYQPQDREQIMLLAEQVRFDSRFSRDAAFRPEKVRALYAHWLSGLLSAPETDRLVHVVCQQGKVVAAGGVRRMDLSRYAGNRTLFGEGIFLGLPEATGAYLAVLDGLIECGLRICDALETKVSANNMAAVRALERLGYSPASSQYALHRAPL